jgi:hypothetical protein
MFACRWVVICLTVTLVILLTKLLENNLSDEELEVIITNKRVQQLKRELQGEAGIAVERSTPFHNADYEAQISEDEAKKVPGLGDNGVAVALQGEEAKQAEDLMKVEAFNIVLSDKIPYSRTLPDARNPK